MRVRTTRDVLQQSVRVDVGRRTIGTTTYSYDALYRLTSVTFPGSRTVGYGYDDAGRRTSITYPGGSNQVTYGYDAANRLTSVTDWNLATTTYAYDDAGRMTTATLPSSTGVVSTYTYDDADRLLGISHDKGLNTLASVDYTLDAVGNRTQRVDQIGTHTYAYDDLYRLTSVTYPGPSTTGYAFDAFGNRTSMTTGAATTTYAYDDADRLTSVTPPGQSAIGYTWDDNGNLTGRGSDAFSWDYNDRMVAATIGGVSSSFAYLGDGLRNSRTVGSTTTVFTWDIAGGLPVVLDDGSQYVYGAGLLSQVSAAGTYYYLADGLGSTMKTVDSSGVVVNQYEYDVYGTLRSSSGSQDNEFQFAGQQTDPTGLQYLRARYYEMETGTFLSRDPLAASQAWMESPFAYASANATNLADPLGLFGCGPLGKICDGAAAVGDWLGDRWNDLTGFVKKTMDAALHYASLVGEKALRLVRAAIEAGERWMNDPLNQITVAVTVSAIATELACGAVAAGALALVGVCAAAGSAYIVALEKRYKLLQDYYSEGKLTDLELDCEISTDIVGTVFAAQPFVQLLRIPVHSVICTNIERVR